MLEDSYFEIREKDLMNALAKIEGDIKQHVEAFHRVQGALVELRAIAAKSIAPKPVEPIMEKVENEAN